MTERPIWHLIDTRTVGGIERHIATLAECFAERGIPAEVVLYQDHGDNPWLAQLQAVGARVHHLDGTPKGLFNALRTHRPALLHTHGYKANILGRVAARLAGVRVVSTFHSGERQTFPVSLYYWLDRWTAMLAPRIAVSDEIAARLPVRATHIPNFIRVPTGPSAGPLPRRVGFVGRLSSEKAPDLFCELAVRALASADRATAKCEWHVYGDGPMRAALEAQYGDRVRFHGLVTDVSAVWPTLGLVCMPSRFEGLPLASLEALAAGVPVLASAVGALPDVVVEGRSGWTFPSGDLDAAERALTTWAALNDVGQADLRGSAWDHVRQNFSDEARLPMLFKVYETAGLKLADNWSMPKVAIA